MWIQFQTISIIMSKFMNVRSQNLHLLTLVLIVVVKGGWITPVVFVYLSIRDTYMHCIRFIIYNTII